MKQPDRRALLFALPISVVALFVGRGIETTPVAIAGIDSINSFCTGDCNHNGLVTVDELVIGVDIALGTQSLNECSDFDVDQNGRLSVEELVKGVDAALRRCAVPTARPTVTPQPTPTATRPAVVVEGDSFTLPAGEVMEIDGDITIRMSETVEIAGDLAARFPGGQNITIEAGGNISISGAIVAGNGGVPGDGQGAGYAFTGSDGGSVIIQSTNGDIDLGDDARIFAGDGVDGGRGGDLVFSAPEGFLFMPDRDEVFHLGNGGHGTPITITKLDDIGELEDLPNHGGDSGLFVIDAYATSGIFVEILRLTESVTFGNGRLSFNAGKEISIPVKFTVEGTPVSGGRGGDAGSFELDGSAIESGAITRLNESPGSSLNELVRRGAAGGGGYYEGGDGGHVVLRGLDGASPGADGQSVMAVGGNGGGCARIYSVVLCDPGDGGTAEATGGDGAAAADAGQSGGNGGGATAAGGNSANRPEDLPRSTTFRRAGIARATGGNGGSGGSACSNPSEQPGRGGNGGPAYALGGNAAANIPVASRGAAFATGGDGGRGGGGITEGGDGGIGGTAEFLAAPNALGSGSVAEGVDGESGTCR